MSIRHTILRSLLLLSLAACAGSGPGAGGGPLDGSTSVGGGNYAAGPVSLPAPTTLNKNLIVCENIAGPNVECRGSAGAVSPYARVAVSVHPAGFTWRNKLESLFLGTAYAAGFSTVVNADGTGAFKATVEAAKGEVIQIQVGASRLLLTVPDELSSVSGSTGTMKNMTVDSDGNIWFSRREAEAKKTAFRWTSLIFSEARAAEGEAVTTSLNASVFTSTQSTAVANLLLAERNPEGASCGGVADTTGELGADAAVTTRCEVKRLAPGSEESQVVASFPGCAQEDIRFIRPTKKNDSANQLHSYILVGIRRSIYVVNVDQVPGTIVKRLVFPSEVLSADDLGDNVYVTLNAALLPETAPKIYLISKVSWGNFAADCIDDSALTDEMAVYRGLQSVVSVDSWGTQFALVGHYADGYRVLAGSSSLEFIYTNAPKEIFRSSSPLEVVIAAHNWDLNRSVFAVLATAEKKLYMVEAYKSVEEGRYVDRIATYTFDLGAYNGPYSLKIDRDNDQLAFLDRGAESTRLVLLPYQADKGVNVDLAAAVIQDLGSVTPSGLVWVPRSGGSGEWAVNNGGTSVRRFNADALVSPSR